MFKEVYRIDSSGFHIETLPPVEFGENEMPLYELEDDVIGAPNPHGFVKAKWTGSEWVEGATQKEIDEATKPQSRPLTDTEILGQQMTERELESIVQGQQITDMDLRLFMIEMGAVQ